MFDDNTQTQNTTAPTMPAATPVTDPVADTMATPSPAPTVTTPDPMAANPGFSVPSLPTDPVVTPETNEASAPLVNTTDPLAASTTPAFSSATETTTDTSSPVTNESTPSIDTPSLSEAPSMNNSDAGSSDLLSIKQDALQSLSPLLGQLEQSPEEKFRTTMMLIQASDNQTLIQAAYDAAKEISDEKIRAQALLDIVNEINYFTQQAKSAA